ncbi:MAG: hypothetical protein OQL11_11115 [Gammaproteobacteria bacterium]|nr:hypothetical protein [Gammaproteobacteria bacterium]
MNPWSTNPCWQNFSSLYREVVAAQEAPNEIGLYHHLTASLYFGMAALEAFLNQQMREHLKSNTQEAEIFATLRRGRITDKLRKWPAKILSDNLPISEQAMEFLVLFNEVRGDLTHPKTNGFDIYTRLEKIEPEAVLLSVAEYIVCFYQVRGENFPYWLFGWNYLNPSHDTHEIIIIHNQQFMFSLQGLGFNVPGHEAFAAEQWQKQNMSSFTGYQKLKRSMESLGHCELKNDRFPYQPKLCRRWWIKEHHKSCGYVSQEAIKRSLEFDA